LGAQVATEQNESSPDIAGLFVAAVIDGGLANPPLKTQIEISLGRSG
jgi:hypothetical protein